MALSEIDLFLPASERIRRHEFTTVRRGYDQVQVRDYLKEIAGHVAELDHKLVEARLQTPTSNESASSSTQPIEDPYDKLASRVAELLRAAEAQSDRIVVEAQAEAAHTLHAARTEAERVRADADDHADKARREADHVLSDSKIASEQTLAALTDQREALITQLHQMQAKLLDVARELETTPAWQETEPWGHGGTDRPGSEPAGAEPSPDLWS